MIPLCGQPHPIERHKDLTCGLSAGHYGEHWALTRDNYGLHWCAYQAPLCKEFDSHEEETRRLGGEGVDKPTVPVLEPPEPEMAPSPPSVKGAP